MSRTQNRLPVLRGFRTHTGIPRTVLIIVLSKRELTDTEYDRVRFPVTFLLKKTNTNILRASRRFRRRYGIEETNLRRQPKGYNESHVFFTKIGFLGSYVVLNFFFQVK